MQFIVVKACGWESVWNNFHTGRAKKCERGTERETGGRMAQRRKAGGQNKWGREWDETKGRETKHKPHRWQQLHSQMHTYLAIFIAQPSSFAHTYRHGWGNGTCTPHMCVITHSYVPHDSFILFDMCYAKHTHVRYNSFAYTHRHGWGNDTCTPHMCVMTHSYVWHDSHSYVRAARHIHVCNMIHSPIPTVKGFVPRH